MRVSDDYYTKVIDEAGNSHADIDILNGKLKVYQIPFKYRSLKTYIYAHRFLRYCQSVNQMDIIENKLFENQLLSDILKLRKMQSRKEKAKNIYREQEMALRELYSDYITKPWKFGILNVKAKICSQSVEQTKIKKARWVDLFVGREQVRKKRRPAEKSLLRMREKCAKIKTIKEETATAAYLLYKLIFF